MEDYETERLVAHELVPEERLLWTGCPRKGILVRPGDAVLIPFSLLWGGFAISWETMAVTGNAPWFFKLWGIPFVVVGLYLIIGRFFVDAKRRESTAYAITDSRVIIISTWTTKTVKSISLRSMADISLSESDDGRGTITFGPAAPSWRSSASTWPSSRQPPLALEGIQNVRGVFELLHR